ncbi:hypothetical protein TNCV_4587231 [Trichonephila clavipes]|nr:hypothetical protein TNCV_4587231 [Trichonephila clavipes]
MNRYPHLTTQHDPELPRKPTSNDSRTSPLTSKSLFIITEHLKASINSLKINGITDERDLFIADLYTSLEEYEKLHQFAVSFSLSPSATPPAVLFVLLPTALALNTSNKIFLHFLK